MSARIRILPFICILSCFMLLGLTTRSYALCDRLPNPYVNSNGTWTVQGNGCYATADDASAACEDHELSGIPCAYKAAGGFGLHTAFYITYAPSAQKTFGIYWIDPDGIGDCSSERSAAEAECGGPDLYVIDDQTCEWHCDDSQDCPDADSDGAADVCDPCPDNPDISEDSVQIYRLNGDSMSEKCGESTMSCDGSIKFEGNTGTICQPVDPPEVEVTECRAVRGAGAVCKADKDTDGDGTYDTDDEDDDGDGIPDSEDTDDDGDGIPDDEDTDHEDYRDYDNDGIPDSQDTDDDNDGTPDGQDKCPRNSDPNCDDSDGDGIPDSEDPDDDGDGIPDSEDEDDDGDGIPDSDELNPFPEPSPFTLEFDVAALFQKYLDRFSEFLTSMRQTSVFSIPDQVLGGIPSSGGSPVVTISTGESFGGDHEIDFSGWASGLAVIRGVLYAVFTALAVRIIILKR